MPSTNLSGGLENFLSGGGRAAWQGAQHPFWLRNCLEVQIHLAVTALFWLFYKEVANLYRKQAVKL